METTLSKKAEILPKLDTKSEFIRLRASGLSLRACAKELGVNKDTCLKWSKDLKSDIAEHKAERLRDIYSEYGLYKEARIKALGTALNNIDTELSSRDLSDVSTDKLLDYKLKYTTALGEEYIPLAQTNLGHNLDAREVLRRLDDLYERVRAGETSKDQAQTELTVLAGMLRSYETTELESKVEKLRSAIA